MKLANAAAVQGTPIKILSCIVADGQKQYEFTAKQNVFVLEVSEMQYMYR